jgi:poly-gamma-glutamate synthesis protein (capsule biosynthesis protein)
VRGVETVTTGEPIEFRGEMTTSLITISLCGDVMTGRGIDQALHHPCDPVLFEPHVRDARRYLELAERANGSIPKPIDDAYVWGDALEEWDRVSPDVRIINLETSITKSNDHWPGKEVCYRMNPENIGCLKAACLDCCSLANNHVLDWGYAGLEETLHALRTSELRTVGAGHDRAEAMAPVVLEIPAKGRVVVFSVGSVSSGIPPSWAAQDDRPGVNLLDDFSDADCCRIREDVARIKSDGDIVVLSIHWGGNWGYEISAARRRFAHRLIDEAGVDLVYGHSSHHVQGIEVYRQRLILYGCGDFLDDYEGISGHEEFRDDLGLLYFATVDPATGTLASLRMMPAQVRQLRVRRADHADAQWLANTLNRESREFGVQVEMAAGCSPALLWSKSPSWRA